MPRGDGIRMHNARIVERGSARFVERIRDYVEEHLEPGAGNRFGVPELAAAVGLEPRAVGVFLSSPAVLDALGAAMPGFVWQYERRAGSRAAALAAVPREIQAQPEERAEVAAAGSAQPWFTWPWE